jgi:hypothetical protein
MERLAVTARLRPGTAEDAARLIGEGPPFDPAEAGFDRHAVFLGNDYVIFVFEGEDAGRRVAELVNDPVRAAALSSWAPYLEGTPALAREAYTWERS